MKRTAYIIIALAVAITASSCEKWLEATSSTNISKDLIFSNRTGFHEALSGIYIDMGSQGAYGADYSWYVTDLISYPYISQTASTLLRWQNHQFNVSEQEDEIESMWRSGYNIIANANMVLSELDNRRDIISDEREYNLIKGELLAIRAYVHFDLMTLFGNNFWSGENLEKKAIPYQLSYSKDVTEQLTYRQTLELLHNDIDTALECLKEDPVRGSKPADFDELLNADGYWNNRTRHLNYFAVKAFLARELLWEGRQQEAKTTALDVVAEALGCNAVSWIDLENFMGQAEDDSRDWTFSTEQLFSLDVTGLYDSLNLYFFNSSISGQAKLWIDNSFSDLYLYPIAYNCGLEDVRGPAKMLKFNSSGYIPYKHYGSSGYYREYRNRMPMVRISEMYLIAAEADILSGNYESSLEWFNQIRRHRGISEDLTIENYGTASVCGNMSTTDPEYDKEKHDFLGVLYGEYLREFVGEGRCFSLVKRIVISDNYDKYLEPQLLTTGAFKSPFSSDFILPFPEAEINYGHIQE